MEQPADMDVWPWSACCRSSFVNTVFRPVRTPFLEPDEEDLRIAADAAPGALAVRSHALRASSSGASAIWPFDSL